MKTSKKGGARPGAGRPRTSTRLKKGITIESDIYAWTITQPLPLSDLIDKALRLLKKSKGVLS